MSASVRTLPSMTTPIRNTATRPARHTLSTGVRVGLTALACSLSLLAAPAHARTGLSEAPALSAYGLSLGVFVSGYTAATAVEGSAKFTVKAVQASGQGMRWVLERADDGVQASARGSQAVVEVLVSGAAAGSLAVGQSVTLTAQSTGVLIEASGQAIAFVPNEIGKALLSERKPHQPPVAAAPANPAPARSQAVTPACPVEGCKVQSNRF